MANVDLVAIPAQDNYATLDNLRLGRSSQQVVARLLRHWDARNIKKNGEFMGIVLLLLDEKSSTIHGFIPPALATQYREVLQDGTIFQLGVFEVGRCTNFYRITDHPFLIRFLPETSLVPLTSFGASIAKEKFMLRSSDHLQTLANTNLELPDIAGQIRYVQGPDLTDATSTQRLVIRFQIDMSTSVSLSLWDDAAATFRAHLSAADPMPSVMVVTTVNPKLFGGNLFLNSTPATRFFFDPTIQAINEFTQRFNIEAATPFTRVDTSNGIRKKETVDIQYLFRYISQANEQEADFLCKARILGVLHNNGWSYISCSGCSRKLDKYGTTLRCTKCVSPAVTGVVRFRVELAVHDGHAAATFVVFDKEMTRLTTKTAAALTLDPGTGGSSDDLPQCLKDLAGKKYLFQVKLTPFNFSSKHRTFTVSTMTPDASADGVQLVGDKTNLDHNGAATFEVGQTANIDLGQPSGSTEHSEVDAVENPRKRERPDLGPLEAINKRTCE